VFNQLGWGEISVLLVLGLFVFGPERLPGMAAEAGKALRRFRAYAKGMTDELKTELGPEVGDLDLASLNPRTFVRKHLFEDDPDEAEGPASYVPRRTAGQLPPTEVPPWDPETT
jgi:sec-independent protein translocase protein TatB